MAVVAASVETASMVVLVTAAIAASPTTAKVSVDRSGIDNVAVTKTSAAIMGLVRLKVSLAEELSTAEVLVAAEVLRVFRTADSSTCRPADQSTDHHARKGIVSLITDKAADDRAGDGAVTGSSLSVTLGLRR